MYDSVLVVCTDLIGDGCKKEFPYLESRNAHVGHCALYREKRGLKPHKRQRQHGDSDSDEPEEDTQTGFVSYKYSFCFFHLLISVFREWKSLYEDVLVDSQIATNMLKSYETGTTKVYGETLPNLVQFFIKQLKITENDVFYDIGSGTFLNRNFL